MVALPAEQRLIVNKQELAAILDTTLPTLNKILIDYPEAPVITRGTNGQPWEFDAVEFTEYLRKQREAEAEAARSRAELQKQFSLPGVDLEGAEGGAAPALTAAQRLAVAKARMMEKTLARELGQLLLKTDVRMALTTLVEAQARFLTGLPNQLSRRFGLTQEVSEAMERWLDEQRDNFVNGVEKMLDDAGAGGP